MKNENLKNALKIFNEAQLGKNSKIEILNPNAEGTIKGGGICNCRKSAQSPPRPDPSEI